MPRCAAFRNSKLQNIEMFFGESALHTTADSALARQGCTALTGMGPASRLCIKIRRRSRKVPPEMARLILSFFGSLSVEGVKDRKGRAGFSHRTEFSILQTSRAMTTMLPPLT